MFSLRFAFLAASRRVQTESRAPHDALCSGQTKLRKRQYLENTSSLSGVQGFMNAASSSRSMAFLLMGAFSSRNLPKLSHEALKFAIAQRNRVGTVVLRAPALLCGGVSARAVAVWKSTYVWWAGVNGGRRIRTPMSYYVLVSQWQSRTPSGALSW